MAADDRFVMMYFHPFAIALCLLLAGFSAVAQAQIGADPLPGDNTETAAPAESGDPGTSGSEELISPDSAPVAEVSEVIAFRSLPVFPGDPAQPARQAWNQAEMERAARLAREFLEENPQNIEARLILADALEPMFYRREIAKLYEDANALAVQAPEAQPAGLRPFLDMKLGLIYQVIEENDLAEPFLRAAAENYELYTADVNARVFNALGHVFEAQGRQEEAALAFKTAAEKFGSEAAKAHLEHRSLRQEIRDLGL